MAEKRLEPARWCLLGLEETMNTIDEAQKVHERHPNDSRIFGDIKKNMVDIFRGLTERISAHYAEQTKRLKQINAKLSDPNINDPRTLAVRCEVLSQENQDLKYALQISEDQNDGYQKDIRTLQAKNKHLAADAAHTKCEVCKHKPRDILFLPCRHFYACEDCSNLIRNCQYCDRKVEENIIVEF